MLHKGPGDVCFNLLVINRCCCLNWRIDGVDGWAIFWGSQLCLGALIAAQSGAEGGTVGGWCAWGTRLCFLWRHLLGGRGEPESGCGSYLLSSVFAFVC